MWVLFVLTLVLAGCSRADEDFERYKNERGLSEDDMAVALTMQDVRTSPDEDEERQVVK